MSSGTRKKFRPDLRHRNAACAAMVHSLDESVGRILAKPHEQRIAGRTIVISTSDNGGYLRETSNAPLCSGKGSLYEGGARMPLKIHWPGITKPDRSRSCSA